MRMIIKQDERTAQGKQLSPEQGAKRVAVDSSRRTSCYSALPVGLVADCDA